MATDETKGAVPDNANERKCRMLDLLAVLTRIHFDQGVTELVSLVSIDRYLESIAYVNPQFGLACCCT